MKQIFLFLICLGAVALTSCKKDDPAPEEPRMAFPDAKFRELLVQKYGFVETDGDIDPNSEVNKAIFPTITELDLVGEPVDPEKPKTGIYSPNGIEYFTEITKLDCRYNKLYKLDLSKNTKLTYLDCSENSISDLNLTNNTKLTTVNCSHNELISLKLPAGVQLTTLNCEYNQLLIVNVSKNSSLSRLYCGNNRIEGIYLEQNVALLELTCEQNAISELNLSKNTKLYKLHCYMNRLPELDITQVSPVVGLNLYCGNQGHYVEEKWINDVELTLKLTSGQDDSWNSKQDPTNSKIKTKLTAVIQ